MKPMIVPAVIVKTQYELYGALKRLKGKVPRLQLDVMDGVFVANHSLDFDFRVPQDFEYEAHLMTTSPLEWIEKHGDKVDTAIIHAETVSDIGLAISTARGRGLKAILALKPETSLKVVIPHLEKVDAILILTVEPGRYGAPFVPETLAKIKKLREISPTLPIEVDGAMNPENVRRAKEAGATIFVSGSYIMKSSDPAKAIQELEEAAKT